MQPEKLALSLDQCRLQGQARERLTLAEPFSLAEAYRIQDEGIRLREGRGERVVGYKMGFTSQAKREQMGLDLPIYGVLTDRMRVDASGRFPLQGTIHPKIEPEVAFIIGDPGLGAGTGSLTPEQALAACSGVCVALEILDSRFANFKYFSLEDVVADNCSSSFFALGSRIHDPRAIDVSDLDLVMSINGQVSQRASSKEISGHPLNSLIQLHGLLAERGLSLPAGSVVLSGAATQAVALAPGMNVELDAGPLGRVLVTVPAR